MNIKRQLISLFFVIILTGNACQPGGNGTSEVEISGEMKKWHTITLTFNGPETHEGAEFNPFVNYKLEVTFQNEREGKRHDRGFKLPG